MKPSKFQYSSSFLARLALGIAVAFILSACAAGAESFDINPDNFTEAPAKFETIEEWIEALLSEEYCDLPCLEGFVPGVSTVDDIRQQLANVPGVSEVNVLVSSLPGVDPRGSVSWNRAFSNGDYHAEAFFDPENDKRTVTFIRHSIPEISLGRLIDAFGDPSHALVVRDDLEGTSIETYVIWQEFGLVVKEAPYTSTETIDGTNLMNLVYQFNSEFYGLTQIFSSQFVSQMNEWEGFGDKDNYQFQR